MNYEKIKQYKKYDIIAIIVLFAIFSAIAVALAQLFQINMNIEKAVTISLQKVIGSARAIIPCSIAFIGSVITAPKGYLNVIKKLCELDPYVAALNVNNEEQMEYQKCPEIIPFLLDRKILVNIISYSLLLFVGIVIATAFVTQYNIEVTTTNSKIFMILLTIAITATLNIARTLISVSLMPKIMVKNYNEIKYMAEQQSKEILNQK